MISSIYRSRSKKSLKSRDGSGEMVRRNFPGTKWPQNKRIQGTLTPYEPIDVAVKIEVSRDVKSWLMGAPDPRSVMQQDRHAENPPYELACVPLRRGH